MKSGNSAFSLIELSILITAASIITATFLMLSQAKTSGDISKVLLTQKNLIEVRSAIMKFQNENGRLPCPSDITRPSQGENIENLDLTTRSCHSSFGSVPAGSLGISREKTLDGWGRKIYYYVSENLCGTSCTVEQYKSGIGNIIVSDIDTGTIIPLTNEGAYVLLSHGASGQGAYLANGNKFLDTSSNPKKQENFNNDNSFIQGAYYQDFDDILLYQTKSQLETNLYNPKLNLISESFCNDNASNLASIDKTIGVNGVNSLRNAITYTKMTDSVSGVDYNRGDEAVLEMMWVLQEICHKLYDTPKVCPGNVVYQGNSERSCMCGNKSWQGGC